MRSGIGGSWDVNDYGKATVLRSPLVGYVIMISGFKKTGQHDNKVDLRTPMTRGGAVHAKRHMFPTPNLLLPRRLNEAEHC